MTISSKEHLETETSIASVRDIPTSKRLLSVDVLRGLCVAGMVLVNFPTDWTLRYHQLGHAEWNGATATGMIFPAFLFLAGFSMIYSLSARSARGETLARLAWHAIVRSLILTGLGLFLNAIPSFHWHTLLVYGVLQRIALCYAAASLLVLGTSTRRVPFEVNVRAVVAFSLLIFAAVWLAVRYVNVPGYGTWRFDYNGNLGAVIDRSLFGNQHLSSWGGPARMWDADGLLSCITSIPNLLLGVLAATWVRRDISITKTIVGMLSVAAGLIFVALLLNPYLVINRKMWTDSFVLLSGGISLGLFAICFWWLDGSEKRTNAYRSSWWLAPALIYGSNAILGYVIYVLLLTAQTLYPVRGDHSPAGWLSEPTYKSLCQWIGPKNVSLIYGLIAVSLVMIALWPLYRKKIFLKL